MTKYEIFMSFADQTRKALRAKREKEAEITTSEITDSGKSCIKIVHVHTLRPLDENNGGSEFDFFPQHCDDFQDGEVCSNTDCPMHPKNKEYIEAAKRYEVLRKQKQQAFKNMFIRGK